MDVGGGRIILSDGGGIRRNVIVVQKPSATLSAGTTSAVDRTDSVTAVSGVTVDSVTAPTSVTSVTADVSVSGASLSPRKVSSAFEQVTFCFVSTLATLVARHVLPPDIRLADILHHLHWLLVNQHMTFKLATHSQLLSVYLSPVSS